jgi:NAD(P)-dependent dehydrogenase (short-subunit alcohol dehydrogenase family)
MTSESTPQVVEKITEGDRRTAVVIGGSGGIGRAAAVALASRGYDTVIVSYYSDAEAVAQTLDALRETGANAVAAKVDISKPSELSVLVEAVDGVGGRLDALVYCAGYRILRTTMTVDEENWQRALDISLTGFVRAVQVLSPSMVAGGKVVGVSGLSGVRAYSNDHLTMGTAKAASHHAMKYLALELAKRSINVNMACFGAVLTDGVKQDLTPEQYEALIVGSMRSEKIPLGRVPEAEEVARVIAFLCSSDADWIVGQVIVADGGETLR